MLKHQSVVRPTDVKITAQKFANNNISKYNISRSS